MTRALLITNPAAARTDWVAHKEIASTLQGGGWDIEVLSTGGPGDARRLAEYGVAAGVDVVTVFGGDGTTMQAAAALVGTDVALGVIPGGTGNLLAGNLRIPASPARAAQALLEARPRPFDLGRMDRPGGAQYFAVACGAGYDARVMAGTLSEQKRRWGMGAYVATSLRLIGDIRSSLHVITIDGVRYEANAAMVLVANCGEVIPRLVKLGPGISPNDGLLDVVVIRANNFSQSVRAVWDLLRLAPGAPGEGTYVGHARGQEVRVETEGVQPVQLDGEPGGGTPFTATVVPKAIRIMVPRRSASHGKATASD
ncbi:MAG TPA: diacylglycerol kinase family protein [Gemmatimonadales bacterium]|nr:diacylglycerol kinase family protein [Gemmatimonadales bacterium]